MGRNEKSTNAYGPSTGTGMGPKRPKDQPFGDYRLQWSGRG